VLTKVQRTLVGTWSAVPVEEGVILPRYDFTKNVLQVEARGTSITRSSLHKL
jgi:hypothetical protein